MDRRASFFCRQQLQRQATSGGVSIDVILLRWWRKLGNAAAACCRRHGWRWRRRRRAEEKCIGGAGAGHDGGREAVVDGGNNNKNEPKAAGQCSFAEDGLRRQHHMTAAPLHSLLVSTGILKTHMISSSTPAPER